MKALFAAFTIYSRIPMPHVEWGGEDARDAMCFFPLVGAAVGAAFFAAACLLFWSGAGTFLRGAALAAVPVLVTGGIHVDGFLDTCDARASFGDRERKLEILKDPHAGAFAVTGGVLYFLLLAGAYGELDRVGATAAAAGFVLSRSLSGLAVALLPNARGDGMLAAVAGGMRKEFVCGAMLFAAAAAAILMFLSAPGGGVIAALCAAVGCFLYFRHVAVGEFGGITGDLAGWFLELCELVMALALALFR